MKRFTFLLLVPVFLFSFREDGYEPVTLVTIGKVEVKWDSLFDVITFKSGMMIDADGSPRAYHPNDSSGLDPLSAAGKNGVWWGIVTDAKGKPFIQDSTCPCPGFYISCTSLEDPSKKISDPARYVNAEVIPYFVLPNNKTLLSKVKKGDIALVKNLRNGKMSFAIFADVGPKDKIGEGSIALANSLGVNSSPRHGGINDSISYRIFLHSGDGRMKTINEIDSLGLIREENSRMVR